MTMNGRKMRKRCDVWNCLRVTFCKLRVEGRLSFRFNPTSKVGPVGVRQRDVILVTVSHYSQIVPVVVHLFYVGGNQKRTILDLSRRYIPVTVQ